MFAFVSEFTGTAMLIILGEGVVANVILNKTKGNGGGLIAIAFGWAIAVFVGVYIAAPSSGAHLNPVVTWVMAGYGKLPWSQVPLYMAAQLLGAMAGAGVIWIAYRQHFDATDDADLKLAVFCTSPAISKRFDNFMSELIGTFVFMLAVLFITKPGNTLGALDALPVALVVLGIGLSLGGPTGYAINPARDLGPRIMHAILPIRYKGSSNWQYAWIPVLAPFIGATLAAFAYDALTGN